MTPTAFVYATKRWASRQKSGATPIFTVGSPRSGTTLLKTLLVAHTKIAGTLYESTGLFRIRDLRSFHVSGMPAEEMRVLLDTSHSISGIFEAVAETIKRQKKAALFVDKLTVKKWRLSFVTNRLPNAKFLHIVRDGRDCYCSATKHPNAPQARSLKRFAEYWTNCIDIVEETVPNTSKLSIKYEDLTAAPNQVLMKIMDWIGLSFEPGQLDVNCYNS